ncbi:ABC transporter ATP-binding protein [Frankia sp. AgB1.9]|uniref:ABC transporter ATP-binding protein n=1 Tax=unclassified Frankia TaxID=2632575 RepID=UPI001931403E|nr:MULTISPECIES: ABC transporter ATP-binding protein [unclassified Frankia]MBL7486738.1 ABC transporter ATP-binding protein [Frankia sp. AgW1.1]MBL7551491.1 ABC transporter ATP-binding protein [Frankia sp. AgB1.9]MBL7623612.1 ABC transporter ATP-binding protein [Frankia sp. AgB1.8]
MLSLHDVTAGYGGTTVLHEVTLTVGAGEVVALLGPNGAGKTTLLRAATGLLRPRTGRVELAGTDLTGRPPHVFTRAGVCLLPEGRGIFPSLTVRENLMVQARGRSLDAAVTTAAGLFPILGTRLRQTAGSLSGGEQQMLALARAYLTEPSVVLVDEASLGLAPIVVDTIYEALGELARRGVSLVVVEQYAQKALAIADRVYVLRRGTIVHTGRADETSTDEIYRGYLGIPA